MKKLILALVLIQSGLIFAQTKTVVTVNGEKVQINPNSVNTADNGLNSTAGNVQLGGALLKPTTVTATSSNTLAIAGLQAGANTDNVLVADSNGVLKWVTRASFTQSGDNLGNHTATQDLNMNTNSIVAANNITAAGKLAVGVADATNTVHIKGASDPLRVEGIGNALGTDEYGLVISGSGVVRKAEIEVQPEVGIPIQLACTAGFNTENDVFLGPDLGYTIKQLMFKGKRFDPKNSYNNATGVFTAPESGYYKFECVLLLHCPDGGVDQDARIGISKPNQLTFANGNASFSSLNQFRVTTANKAMPVVIPYSGMQFMNKGEQCTFGVRYFGNWDLNVSIINYDVKTSSYMSITFMGSGS